MASHPPKTPPPPISKYGPLVPSPQGLRRAMRELPTTSPTPGSFSSRKSSGASLNKPLPPEPPPPLFSLTPSPKLTPEPHEAHSQAEEHRQQQQLTGNHDSNGAELRQTVTSKPEAARSSQFKSPQYLAPSSTAHQRQPSPLDLNNLRRPYSVASTRTSAIIESYTNRNATEHVPRAGTPLIAPHAQNSRVLSMQPEKLQEFERFDPLTLSPVTERTQTTQRSDKLEIVVQRKDTLAYRFNTPTESDPPLVIQQPLWAENLSLSSGQAGPKHRDTLLPEQFSPTSEYEDDEPDSTPTIPVLPPLPVNSPFRMPIPAGSADHGCPEHRDSSSRKISTHQLPTRRSQASSHEESYAPHIGHISGDPRNVPEKRLFGSQASWEPGDDGLQSCGSLASSSQYHQRLADPLNLQNSKAGPITHLPPQQSRPTPNQYTSPMPGTPPPFLGASVDRPVSGPAFPDILGNKSSDMAASKNDKGRDYIDAEISSRWSDDSDDGGKRLRGLGAKLRKKRAGRAQSAASEGSGISPTNTNPQTSVESLRTPRKDRTGEDRERLCHDKNTDESISGTHDALNRSSLTSRDKSVRLGDEAEKAVGLLKSVDRQGHRSLPPVTNSTIVSPSGVSSSNEGFSPQFAQKSRTWGMTSLGEKTRPASGGEKSPRNELGWLAKLRKKDKAELRREKWREDMKRKIKVVQGEPQGMMAIVATREMRDRSTTQDGSHALDHF